MNIKSRQLIFATFFGSCIAIGFLLASLTTNQWVSSTAEHTSSTKSSGTVNYGLFSGVKSLDIGYGVRTTTVNVVTLITTEPDIMNYWLWLGAALGTGFGLLSSAMGAIASVLKAASASKKHGTMVLLFIANISSAISQIIAFICWLVQFFIYLKHNVLPAEDRKINWHTRNLASIGISFYYVIFAVILVLINVVILIYVHKTEKKEKRQYDTPDEDKTNAIMLY